MASIRSPLKQRNIKRKKKKKQKKRKKKKNDGAELGIASSRSPTMS